MQRTKVSAAALVACALLAAPSHAAVLAAGVISSTNNQTCVWADGTSTPGTCMLDEEFNGNTLPTEFLCPNEFEGPFQQVANGGNCFRCENVSCHDGVLDLAMTVHARPAAPDPNACTQTWLDTPTYELHYGASGDRGQWPIGQATAYDLASVNTRTFNLTGGRISIRAQQPAGTGPGSDFSLFTADCQYPNAAALGALVAGNFATADGRCPNAPTSYGGFEIDLPNFSGTTLSAVMYVPAGLGAPGPLFTFFGQSIYGITTNNVGGGTSTVFSPNALPTTLKTAFHIYETDWDTPLSTGTGSWKFSVDSVEVSRTAGAWIVQTPLFPFFWNADAVSVDPATLPQHYLVDYLRVSCPRGRFCKWVGGTCPVGKSCSVSPDGVVTVSNPNLMARRRFKAGTLKTIPLGLHKN